MKTKHTLVKRVFGKRLLFGLIVIAGVIELSAVPPASSIDAYVEEPNASASAYIASDSPVYLPQQWPLATGGRLRGFIRPANGLNIAASANTFLDIFEPLSGQLLLGNGSTLNLESDLFLTSSASLAVGTTSGHSATLKSTQAAAIHLAGDMSVPADRTIFVDSPELTIDGSGFACNFASASAALSINSGKTLTLRNMVINGLTGASQIVGSGTLKLQNCIVNLPGTTWGVTSVDDTRILIADDVVVRGGGQFTFASATSLTVSVNSMLSFDNNTTFSFAPRDKSRTRLYFGDSSSILRLNGSTFCAPGRGGFTGASLAKGTLILDNKTTFSNSRNSDTAKGITFGNGSGASDLAVRLNAGASINLDCGTIDYQNVDA